MAAVCNVPECGWAAGEPVKRIAQALVVWHVYEKHRELWLSIAGDRPPRDPDPRDPAGRAYLSAQAGSN